jgi:hypothetical protein
MQKPFASVQFSCALQKRHAGRARTSGSQVLPKDHSESDSRFDFRFNRREAFSHSRVHVCDTYDKRFKGDFLLCHAHSFITSQLPARVRSAGRVLDQLRPGIVF